MKFLHCLLMALKYIAILAFVVGFILLFIYIALRVIAFIAFLFLIAFVLLIAAFFEGCS